MSKNLNNRLIRVLYSVLYMHTAQYTGCSVQLSVKFVLLRRDLWTIHGVEESSGVNSSPAGAAGQVVHGEDLIRLNSSEFKNPNSDN